MTAHMAFASVLLSLGFGTLVADRVAAPAEGLTPDVVRFATATQQHVLVGVFEGRTPCGKLFVDFTGYRGPACEKMKWWVGFYHDTSGRPTKYEFKGTRISRTGKWSRERATATDPDAVVYRLETDLPIGRIEFLRADENILLLLDRQRRLMVGDASWSYTLSRTK